MRQIELANVFTIFAQLAVAIKKVRPIKDKNLYANDPIQK